MKRLILCAMGLALAVTLGGCGARSHEAAGITSTAKTAVKTPAQIKAEAVAKVRAQRVARAKARVAARARAKAAAAARVRARAEAAAHAADVAAANRWHQGYSQQDGNVFWRWRSGLSCADYVQVGCWHVEVITRSGCSSYVAVHANEYSGGTIINELLDNQGYGIPPKRRASSS
jgi:hypothetical protein